jgi:DNA uptake protein ComE-like DNA-binding protein
MKSRIAAWLGLSWQEMKGFVLTLLAMTIVLALPYVIYSEQNHSAYDQATDEAALDSLLLAMQVSTSVMQEEERYAMPNEATAARPIEPFNPNELDAPAWVSLGLKPYLAERMVKYRTKVGSFRAKDDLLKVYGFPEWLYKRLEPFILLPATAPAEMANTDRKSGRTTTESHAADEFITFKETRPVRKQPQKFDLNTADTTQLIALKGIGTATALRIVRFRDALGGFHSLSQLNEIYAITPDALASLTAYAELAPDTHKKININTADVETLKKHPYIGYKLAEVIVNYRKQHGPYKGSSDMEKIRILTPDKLEKLLPYIEF